MSRIGIVFFAAALAVVAPSSAEVVVLDSSQVASAVLDAPENERIVIRLQQAVFDPLQSMPELPAGLGKPSRGTAEKGYYLLQFHGPIRPEWRDEIERRGGEIMDYVADFAYLVRMDANARAVLSDWPELRWHGEYSPAFRIANSLVERVAAARAGVEIEVMARAFPGEQASMVARQLEQTGARITHHGGDAGGGAVFRLRAPESALTAIARIRALAWVEPFYSPELANEIARSNTILKKDAVEQLLGWYGDGQTVAVVDSGLSTGDPVTMHLDFIGRVAGWGWAQSGTCTGWEDNNSHGTHVAGSVLGSGVRSGANPVTSSYAGSNAGMAPKAELLVWSNCEDFSGVPFNDIYSLLWKPLRDFDQNLRVANNSWAQNDSEGEYNIISRETDRFLWDFPDMVIVFAAGNAGTDANADGVSDLTTVLAPSTAKNVITVGGSENLRMTGGHNPGSGCPDYASCWPDDYPAEPIASDRQSDHIDGMYPASGRGPTLSGRLKPDIVAPATNIVSARNESTGTGDGIYDDYYIYMGGTSMAAPQVSGGAAIVREYFQKRLGHNPSAALVKGVLINGAANMAPGQYGEVWQWPDVNQGWGRMDMGRSLIFGGDRHPLYFEGQPGLQTGQGLQAGFAVAQAGHPLRVHLTWTDAPGAEASQGALVNDLDLELVLPDNSTLFGFGGVAGQPRDRWNVAEAVALHQAPAGDYTVRIIGFNVPQGPQPFALVITGALDVPEDEMFRDRFESRP